MLLEVRWENTRPFLVSRRILGFPSIFKKSQASSPFEALNFMSLSRFQMMLSPLSRWGGELGFSLGSSQRVQTSLHLVRWKTSLHSSHFREIRPYFWSGISVSTQLEAAKSGSLSHTYCSWKAPLEVLVESWPTCSIEFWESAVFSRWYGVHGAFLEFLC